ncbi:Mus7/MMS22 family-domain-containing protein [Gautieria morchelliformis]|nr:Mus7/MMS22 family-domain-containing protein [Gautieria morchelliformis]
MEEGDATEDVVDTSDIEEKELMEAQKPGYYRKVWGVPETENINDAPESYKVSFARLQRTPSKRLQAAAAFDPSPILSRLNISLDFHSLDNPSTHSSPSRTPLTPTSNPPSSLVFQTSDVPFTKPSPFCTPLALTSKPPASLGFHSSDFPSMQSSRSPAPLATNSNPPPSLEFQSSVLPLTQPSPSRNPLTSPSNPSPSPASLVVIPPDPEPHQRTYSLRHRSAKQLNPFQYDKQQYKNQLRGVPEAIVKDPNMDGGRGGRKERYRQQGETYLERGEVDADDEWRAREKRREKQLEREALDAKLREYGISESSEDGEVLMEPDVVDQQGEGDHLRGKKRRRRLRIQEFPMAAELKNTRASSSTRQSTPPAHRSPKRRPRPQPNYQGCFQATPQSLLTPAATLDQSQMVVDNSFDDLGDNIAADAWSIPSTDDQSHLPMEREKESTISAIIVDSSEDEITLIPSKRRFTRRTSVDSDVKVLEDDTGRSDATKNDDASMESQEDIELTAKVRKQLKALGRMVPAALRNRMLAGQEDKTKARAKERPGRPDSEDGDIPLQPGRGRKRMVSPNSRDPQRYMIRGDTETESEGLESEHMSEHEIIVVDDEEEDAEQALEESEDGLDAEDIQTWLAPELQADVVSYGISRRHRSQSERDRPRGGDLIDRMLQRTKRVMPRVLQTTKSKPHTRRPRNPAIKVITREARRLGVGGGRQTKLTFPKADPQEVSPGVVVPEQGNREYRIEAHEEMSRSKRNKKNKKKRDLVQSKLWVIQGDGHKITSGRHRQIIHIDNDDNDFHEALAPVGSKSHPRTPLQHKGRIRPSRADNIREKFCHGAGIEPDAFDMDMNGAGQRHSKISLDFDMVSLSSGLTLGSESYIGKGRLYDFVSVLKGDKEIPSPFSVTLFGLRIDPDMPITQISPTFASACDKLYSASIIAANDAEVPIAVKAADALMHALCHLVTFRALHINEEEGLLVTAISEQITHLVARINERVELISADGHSMDYRTFALYWFAVEIHLRLVYAHLQRARLRGNAIWTTTQAAEQCCVQLLRRLLEYGLDRTIGLLQNGQLSDTTSSNLRTLELWICVFHVAPFLISLPVSGTSKTTPPFWRVVEAAMEAQSNKPDSQLYESERIWRTIFNLCAVSQFSLEGFSTSATRLEAHWPIVKKALTCIRLSADVRDNSKPASTLHKRDTYLRLVTARCFLLCTRWNWRLNDADDVFQELCAIFRSRQFSNLLGEPDDFPTFIREGKLIFLDAHRKDDTAFSLFLKLIVRAAKDFHDMDGLSRLKATKLVRLLNLAVPVGSTSFTKVAPPTGQGLSMLYNRYSAIFVAIYVDSSVKHVRSRLQQVRRYVAFKDADCDSRTATIRSMMHVAILLRHLSQPLDDVLSWASEMIDDLIGELTSIQARDGDPTQNEKEELVVLVQLLLGSIRMIISTPTLSHSDDLPATYPDIGLLHAWMSRILSNPITKDHRTGLEICKCIQSFLVARRAIIPLPPVPKPAVKQQESQESQDEYGDGGLDLNDPALLDFLADVEDRPDDNAVADHKTSDVLDTFSQPLYTCLCMHLGCTWTTFGGPYYEADQWLECWLGAGSVLVKNKKRVWDYYFQLGESAWKDMGDSSRRIHLRLQFLLTVLRLDPNVYKSRRNQILGLWFECIVSPNVTIEHDFTAHLFSVDSLRHALFQNLPCIADAETGYFAFSREEFKRLRLPLIEAVLSNLSAASNSEVECIPLVETLLGTVQNWIEVINQDVVRRVEYVEFGRKIISVIRNHDALARHPRLQKLLTWGGSL